MSIPGILTVDVSQSPTAIPSPIATTHASFVNPATTLGAEQSYSTTAPTARFPMSRPQPATRASDPTTPDRGTAPVLVTTMWDGTLAPLTTVPVASPSACLRMSIPGILTVDVSQSP